MATQGRYANEGSGKWATVGRQVGEVGRQVGWSDFLAWDWVLPAKNGPFRFWENFPSEC